MARILLVDDDIIAHDSDSMEGQPTHHLGPLGLYISELENRGHQLSLVGSPDEALMIIEEGFCFDLIIVDVMMPVSEDSSPYAEIFSDETTAYGMSTGFQLAKILRKRDRTVKIVLFSNIVSDGQGLNSATTGELVSCGIVNKVVPKIDYFPVPFADLIEQLLS